VKVLLINPPSQGAYDTVNIKFPPLGLAYIAAVLREHGHKVQIIDLNVDDNLWERMDKKWDIVGISGDTSRYPIALKIASQIKKHYHYPIMMGGPHVSFFEKETLDTGVVDYVIRGEGEYISSNLLNALEKGNDPASVSGIAFKKKGELVKTPPALIIEDLDNLPLPARDLLPMKEYRKLIFQGEPITTLVTSRGCPFNCYFCSSSQFFGLKWRSRSIKNILGEIEYLIKKYDYRRFAFMDDNFTLNTQRVIQLSKEIIKRKLNIKWWAFSRVDELLKKEEMVKLMIKSGCRMLFLGIESVSKKILDEYNKRITANDSLKAVQLLKKYEISTWGSFIIGGLDETKEMILNTIKFSKLLNPEIVQFSILTPFPGTRLYQDAVKAGIIIKKEWQYFDGAHAVMRTYYLKSKEIQRLILRSYFSFHSRPNRLIKIFPTIIEYLIKLPGKRTQAKRLEKIICDGPG